MTFLYDFIVIGTGGVGSAALYHLASRGAKVLGLDRFAPGHDLGSSHGQTRIIRQAYYEHPDYVPLLFRAYELWDDLGRRVGRQLRHEIGLLQAGPAESAVLAGVRRSAKQHGLAIGEFGSGELKREFRQFRFPDDWRGVFERKAGYLDVEACVVAHVEQARCSGAELRIGATVAGWETVGDGIDVVTDDGPIRTRGLVVAAGPWAAQLLGSLNVPLEVRRKPQYWYPSAMGFRANENCPAFLFDTPEGVFYGLPEIEPAAPDDRGRGPFGIKVAEHTGGQILADPLAVDRNLDPADEARVERFLADYLPSVRRELRHQSVCMYTMSPDEHFIVDSHPADPRIVFAAGLSGHGFKFTCVLGEALADLAMRGKTELPIGFLSLGRFARKTLPQMAKTVTSANPRPLAGG